MRLFVTSTTIEFPLTHFSVESESDLSTTPETTPLPLESDEHLMEDTSPYGPFMANVAGNISDLTFNNFAIKHIQRPNFPARQGTVFTSNVQRTVSLIGSVVEEAEVLRDRSDELLKLPLKVAIIWDPFCTWD